ncbi:hypothetical protein C8Q77DRAFT_68620 [Trametes polyzona]|nr:hypothetical protein C8Q77DRAFT_68620 [Trametes polyzona]
MHEQLGMSVNDSRSLPSCRRMGQDVTSHWLLLVRHIRASRRVGIRHNLLYSAERTSSASRCSVRRNFPSAVAESTMRRQNLQRSTMRTGRRQKLILVVRVICACVCDIVQHFLAIQSQPLRDRQKADWTEGSLSVDVQALALSAAHVDRKLARYSKCMADLRLPGPELAEELRDCARLDAAPEESVKVLGARRDMYEFCTTSVNFGGTLKAQRNNLQGWLSLCGEYRGREVQRNRAPSAKILSAFCSEMPLIVMRFFLGVYATASTVCRPASVSFLMSCGVIPASASLSTSRGPEMWLSWPSSF